MCGITGFLDSSKNLSEEELKFCIWAMTNTLGHRGPDDSGIWVDANVSVALGHRRLSVVDLSLRGHQPMISASRRFVIAYNGEIYNFREIRSELAKSGVIFRGDSDTEVLLEACAEWGVEAAVKRTTGMFAFSLWDIEERSLYLVRDRLGIKPLYWAIMEGVFLWASELKALKLHPAWQNEIDKDALSAYLRFAYVPGGQCIYRGAYKLEPGCMLTLRAGAEPEINQYWDMRSVAIESKWNRLKITDEEAVGRLDELLRDAVGRRMVADVPLGAFLSGGIDSSTVVALMQAQSSCPVKTFSIGFNETGFNEAEEAKAVARYLGTDHAELYLRPEDALAVIPKLPEYYDEPFADSSQIPTFLVSELAKRSVTVSLSGDGGDELFGGYRRYLFANRLWNGLRWGPDALRKGIAYALSSFSTSTWDSLLHIVPERWRKALTGDRFHKLSEVIAVADRREFYKNLISNWLEPDKVVYGVLEPKGNLLDSSLDHDIPDFIELMQFLDTVTYLPNDILTKLDRASMAISLEARVPLLDHNVAEFAWTLPKQMKIRNGQGKWLLRQVLYRYVPKELIKGVKRGFRIPVDLWLRNSLRDWAEDLLSEKMLKSQGYFDPGPIRQKWREHLSGQRNWQFPLWTILMFQAWHQRWLENK